MLFLLFISATNSGEFLYYTSPMLLSFNASFFIDINFIVLVLLYVPDLLYKANMNTGSVLEYALAFTSAALDKYCTKWSAAPKTGFIDITTSKDFYRIYSGLQIVRNRDFFLTW